MEDLIFNKIAENLPPQLREVLKKVDGSYKEKAEEIRIRRNCPLSIVAEGENLFLDRLGRAYPYPSAGSFIVSGEVMDDLLIRLCGYSLHSHTEEIKNGYVWTDFGIRAGLAVTSTVGNESGIGKLNAVNLRIPKDITNIAKETVGRIDVSEGLLIAGKPSAGKTTFLRDTIRVISDGSLGKIYRVALIDERFEVSGGYFETDGFYLGPSVDIICGKEKCKAAEEALRVMSPQIIACDEIAGGDIEAVKKCSSCGVAFIATVHCGNEDELCRNSRIKMLMDTGAFKNIALLKRETADFSPPKLISREEYYGKISRMLSAYDV